MAAKKGVKKSSKKSATSSKKSTKKKSSSKKTAKKSSKKAAKKAPSKKSTKKKTAKKSSSKKPAKKKAAKKASAKTSKTTTVRAQDMHKKHIVAKTKNYVIEEVPDEYVFVVVNGDRIRNLKELAQVIDEMGHEDFHFHSNETKNDFAAWLHDIHEEVDLAENMWHTSKDDAAKIVRKHLKMLGVE